MHLSKGQTKTELKTRKTGKTGKCKENAAENGEEGIIKSFFN